MEILLRYLLFAEQNYRCECGFKSTKPCGNASDLGYTGIHFRLVPTSSHVKQNLLPFPFPPAPHPMCWQYFVCCNTQVLNLVSTVPGEAQIHFKKVSVSPKIVSYMCIYMQCSKYVCVHMCKHVWACVHKEDIHFIKIPEIHDPVISS